MLCFYLNKLCFFLLSCDCGDDCKHGDIAAKIAAVCDLIFKCFQFLFSNFNPHSKGSFEGKYYYYKHYYKKYIQSISFTNLVNIKLKFYLN